MIKKLLKDIIITLLSACILLITIFNVPQLHRTYLRQKVYKEVVKIVNETGNSGGTGVYIKLPSGNTAILTNAHVCELKNQNDIVWVKDDTNKAIPRRILEESKFSDLCLVEGLPKHKGLQLGQESNLGDMIYIVGHPRLYPTTMTQGEIYAKEFVDVFDHEIIDPITDKCDLPKNKKMHVEGIFGSFDICLEHIESLMSTTQIMPGNSGSPAVDNWGNIIGLVYAGGDLGWSIIIPLKDIKDFIKQY